MGLCGFTDPDNRRTYPWGHEDQELLAFHKEMIRIHKTEKPHQKRFNQAACRREESAGIWTV